LWRRESTIEGSEAAKRLISCENTGTIAVIRAAISARMITRPISTPHARGTRKRCRCVANAASGIAITTTISRASTSVMSWRKTSAATTKPKARSTAR
jgi:hypothetical protein